MLCQLSYPRWLSSIIAVGTVSGMVRFRRSGLFFGEQKLLIDWPAVEYSEVIDQWKKTNSSSYS